MPLNTNTPITAPTIIDLKLAFLRSQILLLSAPLRPSSNFTSSNNLNHTDFPLSERAVDDALEKVNRQIRKSNKLAYGPQGVRHVAEQVDGLYWARGERRGVGGGGGGEEGDEEEERWRVRGAGVDLRQESLIPHIPTEWSPTTTAPELAQQFTDKVTKLQELNEKRKATREKLEMYRKMRALMEPFGAEGKVQENLVTRNGEVEVELERMRMLMLRVERGLEASRTRTVEEEGRTNVDVMDWEEEGRGRLEGILKG